MSCCSSRRASCWPGLASSTGGPRSWRRGERGRGPGRVGACLELMLLWPAADSAPGMVWSVVDESCLFVGRCVGKCW